MFPLGLPTFDEWFHYAAASSRSLEISGRFRIDPSSSASLDDTSVPVFLVQNRPTIFHSHAVVTTALFLRLQLVRVGLQTHGSCCSTADYPMVSACVVTVPVLDHCQSHS